MPSKNHSEQSPLISLLSGITGGGISVIDLTMTLDRKVPTIVLPPELGQSWPFRMEEISRYDAALRRKQLSLVLAGKMKANDATELKALFED